MQNYPPPSPPFFNSYTQPAETSHSGKSTEIRWYLQSLDLFITKQNQPKSNWDRLKRQDSKFYFPGWFCKGPRVCPETVIKPIRPSTLPPPPPPPHIPNLAVLRSHPRQINYIFIYVTANLRNQIFPGIPNPFREFVESLKWISSKSNV